MKLTLPLSLVILATLAVGTAHAWENRGWVKLGEQTVNGRVDHDTIRVGKFEGRFSKLTLVVERSELELLNFEITFGNGEKFHPEVRHYFKEGTRTRMIDLPGDDRVIQKIDVTYRNLPRGGDAKLEVWGWKTEGGGHDEHHRR
ncbi:MAG TPA: hypothetical protein VGC42_28060 [Kofleriaceae bacterium]